MKVKQTIETLPYETGISNLIPELDTSCGMYLSSGIEYPGRYSRWDIGFVNPPLEFIALERSVYVNALNPKGVAWLKLLTPVLSQPKAVELVSQQERNLELRIIETKQHFSEEQRSQQASVFTPLRALLDEFKESDLAAFGLYGAFGYEMIFQFDAIKPAFNRTGDEKLFHLFLPDVVYQVDRRKEQARKLSFSLTEQHFSTEIFNKLNIPGVHTAANKVTQHITDDDFADIVVKAREKMRQGELFEVVPSRKFSMDVAAKASSLFLKMQKLNPSPYEFYCQLGDEQLVGTSPEMFVRVKGNRIESCPISGTIKRGADAIEDEARIRELLNSAKDEVELTMCTDVDRNDKARICKPGSVKILARRSIEQYQGLFHTVDHVEGTLRDDVTAIDGFLSHMWAVTLTGAPKKSAVQAIENFEKTSRRFYGGAVGMLASNGDINTCITIRTVNLRAGKAIYQSGASLVWDSIPAEEVKETHLKANTFYKAMGIMPSENTAKAVGGEQQTTKTAVMIDYEDSFVHTLADYFRQAGVSVATYRVGISLAEILALKPDFVIHSPGPGKPADFAMAKMISGLAKAGVAQFGVCLGLQGMVEAFGGKLKLIKDPRHGKTWQLEHSGSGIFAGIKPNCNVAAYHSIIADKASLPACFEVLATNQHGDIMAIKHKTLALTAVQFHPESILSLQNSTGMRMITNFIGEL